MSDNIACPVSHIMVNENRVRITAFLVFLASVSCLISPGWPVPAILAIDFVLRGFGAAKYSLLNFLSSRIVSLFSVGDKPVDQAPKQFAAQLGFVLADLLLIASAFSEISASYIIAGLLVLFSFLEFALGFCAGCYMYTFFRRFPAE